MQPHLSVLRGGAAATGSSAGHPNGDDMHHMLSKTDLAAYGDYSDSSEYNPKHPRVYKVNHFVLPLFALETLALGCIATLAYYLRFSDVFPLNEIPVNCTEDNLRLVFRNTTNLLGDMPMEVVYSVALLLPLVTILIGELGYWLFSGNPKKVVRAHWICLKLHLMPRRFFRFSGLFLLGLFTNSIFTDAIKLLVGRPRPYFLNVCFSICTNSDGTTQINDHEKCVEEELRSARASFPSSYTSMSVYSAVFVSVYMHCLLTARGARFLRPVLVFGVVGLAMFVAINRFITHRNHWEDVVAGALLGLIIAVYMSIFAGNSFQERNTHLDPLLPHRRKSGASSPTIPVQDSKSPFFSWFPIPRVTFKTKPPRYINGFINHGAADFSHDPAVSAAYHADLNRSLDNYSRTSNHHPMQHY